MPKCSRSQHIVWIKFVLLIIIINGSGGTLTYLRDNSLRTSLNKYNARSDNYQNL